MKETYIIDYPGLLKEPTYTDLDIPTLYSQLISSLSIPKEFLEPKPSSENKFFGEFINKKK